VSGGEGGPRPREIRTRRRACTDDVIDELAVLENYLGDDRGLNELNDAYGTSPTLEPYLFDEDWRASELV